jgi:two-component system response regulator VicR
MQRKKILIIDDEPGMLRLLEQIFFRAGYQVHVATNGREGLSRFHNLQPDLVVLDVMMPIMDGWQTCSYIRRLSNTPIIMLTALGWEDDVVRGLDAGAVDYVVKPFSSKVLLARVKAALRQATPPSRLEKPAIYDDGYLIIDLDEHQVFVRGEPLRLTATEYRLLAYLCQNAGKLLTPQQILENVWGWTCEDEEECVRVYIWRLRRKLEQDSKNPQYLLTEHGKGYRFQKNPLQEKAICNCLIERPLLPQAAL